MKSQLRNIFKFIILVQIGNDSYLKQTVDLLIDTIINICRMLWIICSAFIFILVFNAQPQIFEDHHSVILALPALDQAKSWILNNDMTNLEGIKQIYEKQIPQSQCLRYTTFIDQIVGLCKMGVWSKTIAIKQILKQKSQLDELAHQFKSVISQLKKQQRQNDLPRLQQGLKNLSMSLQQKYTRMWDAMRAIEIRKQSIKALTSQIRKKETIKSSISSELSSQRIELELTEKQIQIVKQQLDQLTLKKSLIKSNAQHLSDKIKSQQKQIKQIRKKTNALVNEINFLQNYNSDLNLQLISLDSDISNARIEILRIFQPYNIILMQISRNSQALQQIENKKASLTTPDNINTQIMLLSAYSDSLQTLSLKAYYDCYIGSKINGVLDYRLYQVSASQIMPYLETLYPNQATISKLNKQTLYKLNVIDIYGQQWSKNYGFPFDEDRINKQNLSLTQDFSCQTSKFNNPSIVGQGTLSYITNSQLQIITPENNRMILLLGACTRLQSSQIPPSIKDTVFFRGFVIKQSMVNPFLITIL